MSDLDFGEEVFKPLCRRYNEAAGSLKTTSAMPVGAKGCVVKVSTERRNSDGVVSIAEALTFVPGAILQEPVNDDNEIVGRSIV